MTTTPTDAHSTVAIVDYGLCNLDSVRRAVEDCGGHPVVTSGPDAILSASHVILPGVGAFPEAMANLRAAGLVEALNYQVRERGVPFLGICLGMQLMASRSTEGRDTEGLGWIDADVKKLEALPGARVPHVGWNEVEIVRPSPLLEGVDNRADFYFVHSYAMHPRDVSDVVARAARGDGAFTAVVSRGNMAGVQFHPEKSQRVGFTVIRNFLREGAR